jgi:hypothetical protein
MFFCYTLISLSLSPSSFLYSFHFFVLCLFVLISLCFIVFPFSVFLSYLISFSFFRSLPSCSPFLLSLHSITLWPFLLFCLAKYTLLAIARYFSWQKLLRQARADVGLSGQWWWWWNILFYSVSSSPERELLACDKQNSNGTANGVQYLIKETETETAWAPALGTVTTSNITLSEENAYVACATNTVYTLLRIRRVLHGQLQLSKTTLQIWVHTQTWQRNWGLYSIWTDTARLHRISHELELTALNSLKQESATCNPHATCGPCNIYFRQKYILICKNFADIGLKG